MKYIFLICFACFAGSSFSQGRLILNQPPEIDTLMMKVNEKNKEAHQFSGYRIQVFQGTDRAAAFQMKKELMLVLPDEDVRLVYNEPHYKLRVGNFRTQIEAQQLYQRLMQIYPQTFIVPDKIDIDDIK